MRSSSSSGFDLRQAVDSLRETFAPAPKPEASTGATEGGDIRAAILVELSEKPMHGYEIIGAVEARSGGTWKPTPGSVYPTLQLLVDEALVSAAQEGERKVYSLTEAGRRAAADRPDPAQPREPQRGQGVQGALALTRSGARLAQALTQIAQLGTSDQSERAIAIVDEARRKVYALLAED